MQLEEKYNLSDKHIYTTAKLLSMQYPDMPQIQSSLHSLKVGRLHSAPDKSIFFHNFGGQWALSHFRDNIIILYDSLQPKSLNSDLKDQMMALYGQKTVRIPQVQKQEGMWMTCHSICCISTVWRRVIATNL